MRRCGLPLVVLAVLLTHCRSVAPPAVAAAAPAPECSAAVVATTSGAVCGLEEGVIAWGPSVPVRAYLGIRYAEAPTGEGRWAPPTPAVQRPGVFPATRFGAVCPQSPSRAWVEQSEDCLTLNVWAPGEPAPSSGWPVMVFIHGGSFLVGGSRAGVLDGRRLAARGPVVVVSLNYRLGAFGFLLGVEGLDGNFGFRDQQLALRWVRDNIGRFGGDARRVTLFGESAGAMSIGLHIIAPASRGLFRAAILESNPYGIPFKRSSEAQHFGTLLRDLLGCEIGGLTCMRNASVDAVLRQQSAEPLTVDGLLEGLSGELVWAPAVDGDVIPVQPVAAAVAVPILIGTNLDEGELFADGFRITLPFEPKEIPRLEYEATLHLVFPDDIANRIEGLPRYAPVPGDNTEPFARLLTDYLFTCANRQVMNQSRAAVFAYQFAHVAAFDAWPGIPRCAPATGRVCHAFELPFVFDNPVDVRLATASPSADRRFAPPDQSVADTMTAYWTHFATTLDPNRASEPLWPRYRPDDPVRVVFDGTPMRARDFGANCAFWDAVGYEVKGLFERIRV